MAVTGSGSDLPPAANEPRVELVTTRTFDAPRARVFEAWTRPELVRRWWGPGGFTLPVCEIDLRPGGAYRFVMRGPDGAEFPVTGVYHEVAPPERLVFTDGVELPDGRSPVAIVTVTFVEQEGRTTVTIRARHETAEDRRKLEEMGWAVGWAECLDRLAALLGGRS